MAFSTYCFPHPHLAHITPVMVSNRFLISKSCLAIPQKSRDEACDPPPSLLPFEVSDIWFQSWHSAAAGWAVTFESPAQTQWTQRPAAVSSLSCVHPALSLPHWPPVSLDLILSPLTSSPILLPNTSSALGGHVAFFS